MIINKLRLTNKTNMKKLFLLLTLVGMIFTACESGGSVEEENGGNTPTLKIELSKQTVDVDFEVGSYSISVTSPYSWDAVSKNDWIIVNSKTGIAGTEELLFSVERNFEEKERKGTILITNSIYNLATELYVVQNAFEPEISIGAETLNFPVEGGRKEVAITANFEYEVSTSASWVTCSKTQKGITVSVPNYKEVDERRAEITIANKNYNISKTIKVAQGAFVPEITIDTEIIEFAAKGGVKDVAITANFEYEVSTSASWVTYSKKQNVITVSVPNYGKIEERTANITISSGMYNISKTIKIRQKGLTEEEYAEQMLVYTSSDGMVVTPKNYFFGANVVSNTYKNGQGVILFDAPITYIGDMAFYECTSLKNITIPDSVTSIGDSAFFDCTSLTSVIIPNSVTSIGKDAFWCCTSLKSVTIGNSVTSIGASAFSVCTSLTSVTIPNSVTSIGDLAFQRCDSLTSVTIGNSVTSIGYGAFSGCSSLTSVIIPNSVTSIGARAFDECTGELIINSKVVGMDWEYKNLKSHWLYGSQFSKVTIGGNVTRIGEYVFCGYSSLISVTIPNSVTSIGEGAFSGCSSLTSVTIGNGVTSIGYSAFYHCTSLTSVTIPDSVTSIGDSAFIGCTSLTSVTIPDRVTSIGNKAFYDCSSLKRVTIPNSVKKIGERAFGGCNSLTSVTIGNGVTSIGEYAFSSCTSLTSVTIPDSVTSIGEGAFNGCTGELIINSKFIEKDSDSDYSSNWLQWSQFSKVTIGSNVTRIRKGAFSNYCETVISITIPDSVTSIGSYAFNSCSSLTSVTIPNSVTSIGDSAFINCTSLKSVIIGNSVTSIGEETFRYCSSLTSVTIPNSVTSIGRYAFCKCTSLKNITIPDSVTSIGNYAFRNCTSLTSVTIGNSVTSIGNEAFYDCTSLKSVTIPNSVTEIRRYAFYGCTSLTSVTIGNSVTSIGVEAFYDCSSLTSVYCKPVTPPTGGSNMFYRNASGRKIYIPRASVSAYKSASFWSSYSSSIVGYDF